MGLVVHSAVPRALPAVPEKYDVTISELRVAVLSADPVADVFETVAPRKSDATPSAGKSSETYAECEGLLSEAKKLAERDLAERRGRLENTDHSQVDFLDRLGECHLLSAALPAEFRARIYQREAELTLVAIEAMERNLSDFVSGESRSATMLDYLRLADWRERAIGFFRDRFEGLSPGRVKFAERDARADFDVLLTRLAQTFVPIQDDSWQTALYFACDVLGMGEEEAMILFREAREPVLRGLAESGRAGGNPFYLDGAYQEAAELGIVLPERPAAGFVKTGEWQRPKLDEAKLAGWEMKFLEGESGRALLYEMDDTDLSEIPSALGDRFAALVNGVVDQSLDELTSPPPDTLAPELHHIVYFVSSLAPVAAYLRNPAEVQGKLRALCGDFFDADAEKLVSNVLSLWSLESFVTKYGSLQSEWTKAFPGALALDTERQKTLSGLVLKYKPAVQESDEAFDTWVTVAQQALVLAPELESELAAAMASRVQETRVSVPGGETAPPEDWPEIVALAQEYVQTLWSYPQAGRTGYNLLYGPLCDVARADKPGYMESAGRIFAHDPEAAAALALLTVKAAHAQNSGMGFVLKHAPGIGSVTVNPEWGRLTVDYRGREEILRELSAFERAFSAEHGTAVMVSGVAYPALEENAAVIRPATLSPEVCGRVRGAVGEDAVLFSDDLGTPAFDDYFQRQKTPRDALGLYVVPGVIAATKAGVDVCLTYVKSRDGLEKMLGEFEKATERGEVTRAELEASVLRILEYKKRLFPDAPALAEPLARVQSMSVRELWAQKIVYPSFGVADAANYLRLGAGGITFEGVQQPSFYMDMVKRATAADPDLIPPFLANNSPQELGDGRSSASSERSRERDLLRELAGRLEADFPAGVPPQIADRLVAEASGDPSSL